MKTDIAIDHKEITVHAMDSVHGMGPVFYASLSCGPSADEDLKHLLVSALWDHLVELDTHCGKRWQSANGRTFPVQLVRGLIGRPNLLLGANQGPAVSLSEGGGKLWAALCGDDSDIGIDVAGPDEFKRDYPFQRVFQSEELQHARRLTADDLHEASALLWSVKESVVKALGCAFHLVDPREVIVYPSEEAALRGSDWYAFQVELSGKALERFPMVSRQSFRVRSVPHSNMWLSIALLNRRPTGHEDYEY